MNKLYEVLELCLQEVEQGVGVDTVLSRYPELADELRPILEASVKAREMAVPAPSQEVVRRNRAKLLQRAAEMRERGAAPSARRRIWSVPLRRALVSLAVVVMLFVSSTGLVRASSNTIPGDNLYPVKRTWEGLLLFFTFDDNEREALELEHENERLDELQELFTKGRSADVMFTGYVTRQGATEWRVAGITILITPETLLPDQVDIGAAVRIIGKVKDGVVIAERIELLAPGSIVSDGDDDEEYELETEDDEDKTLNKPATEIPVTGSKPEATALPVIKTPTPKFDPEDVKLEGVITSIRNNIVVVNGVVMDISSAEVEGSPSVGANAKVEGYYDANGVFIVTKIEFKGSGSGDGNGSDDDNDGNDNSNSNTNDDNDNDNQNSNDDDDSNSNDNDDDNSGSGSGDDD